MRSRCGRPKCSASPIPASAWCGNTSNRRGYGPMAAVNSIQRLRLMERDEIVRRLRRMVGESDVRRDGEITLGDLARWLNVKRWTIQKHMQGKDPINDAWQVFYTQTFAMIDAGELV